jgi:hypothetical protein
MAAEQNGTQAAPEYKPVIRTFARGRLAEPPELRRSDEGVAVCRLVVVGEAPGPASDPPKVSLYLRGSEAVRCGLGLHQGDLIEGVGAVGPERKRARRQEVVVDTDKRVILRARAAVAA